MNISRKISSSYDCTVGVGILSWKSHKTLEKSLQSYEKIGFKDYFDEIKIIFQEITTEDKELAEKYGYDYVGIEKNVGIQGGHKLIYENLKTDYILVLENDNPLVEDKNTVTERLFKAMELLENNVIDVMRLRHRWDFGEGFSLEKYLNFFSIEELHEKYSYLDVKDNFIENVKKTIKRFIRPSKIERLAGYSLYCEKYPEKIFPKYIKKIDEELYIVSSHILTWTNQSVLLKRKFYGELLKYADENPSSRAANGFQDLEKPLNSKWWRNQNYQIGVGEGIFTHNRFDDSWRESHHAFNKVIVE
jgi:hypothetical protein